MIDSKSLSAPLKPNSTIGIVGGGQLGRMIALAAANLGFRTLVLEPGEDCPASQVCNRQIVAAYDDEAALADLVANSDVITYEFENVPLGAAHYIAARKPLYPPARALEVAQDRIVEKDFLTSIGIQVAAYHAVFNVEDLRDGLAGFGHGVLKTRRFGYDGKGQHVFRGQNQVDDTALGHILASLGHGGGYGYILENLIAFDSEFSLIGARDSAGEISIYPAATNIHENGILRRSTVPADLPDPSVADKAEDGVRRILEALDYVGVIGVEFFLKGREVLVNEIAPRVHNTGHWTVEACETGQFEQHVRAVAGLPLGSTGLLSPSFVMENLLGDEAADVAGLLRDPKAHVTLYGKAEARPGRKMGHVTRLAADLA